MKKVVVIGSGAVGLCTAYYLQKEGFDVHVVTASEEGHETDCSYGNAGMVVPSHFVPLAAPGIIKQGLKWMLSSTSPFYIKPRLNSDLLKWLWHFYASANQKNVERSKLILRDLNLASRDLFKDIEATEQTNFSFEQKGLLMLYKTAKYQEEEEEMALKAQALGIDAVIKSKQDILKMEPALVPDVLGGVLYKSDAHMNPNVFMKKMLGILKSKGVSISYSSAITGFETSKDIVTSILTNKEKIDTQEIVVCAGSWSQKVMKLLNVNLPIQGGKGYSMTIPNVKNNLIHPSILCEAKIAMTPINNSLRVAGTMEIAGNNLSIRQTRLNGIKEQVPKFLEGFDEKWFNDIEPWVGLRPVSPDGLPYIGRAKNWKNITVNAGHAMMGLSLAPISGKLTSELLADKKTTLDISILTPERF